MIKKIQDLEHKAQRFKEMQRSLEPFIKELARIHAIMPFNFKFNMETKESIHTIEPEWQKLIDKVTEMMNNHVKENFPELEQT